MKIVYTVSILLVALLSASTTTSAQDATVTDLDTNVVATPETGAEADISALDSTAATTDANFEYEAASVGADADAAAVDEASSTDVTEADREAEPTAEEVGADADAASVDGVGADADATSVEEVGADADADVTEVAEADREAAPEAEEVGADADTASVDADTVGSDADAEVAEVDEADREADTVGADADAVDETVGAEANTDADTVGADADAVDETVGADADAVDETVGAEANTDADTVGADADAVDETVGADAETDATDDTAEVGADDDNTAAAVAEVGADADLDLTTPHSFVFPEVRQQIIMTVNKRRQEAGLPQICLNYKLMNTAQLQANFMAKTNTITVTGQNGTSPSDRGTMARYNSTGVAEVVGAGYTKPDDLINAWMQSADSKAIVLGNYTHIGPGYTVDEKQEYKSYWAVDFSYGYGEACSGLAA
ncbi:hypothetical protein Gpo141_00011245 [Globisporangium polare]